MNPQKGFVVDHINGNKFDNQRSNLRICTHAENMRNIRKQKDNGIRGVSQRADGMWIAQVGFNNHNHFLGVYTSQQDAATAYRAMSRLLFGEFSPLN